MLWAQCMDWQKDLLKSTSLILVKNIALQKHLIHSNFIYCKAFCKSHNKALFFSPSQPLLVLIWHIWLWPNGNYKHFVFQSGSLPDCSMEIKNKKQGCYCDSTLGFVLLCQVELLWTHYPAMWHLFNVQNHVSYSLFCLIIWLSHQWISFINWLLFHVLQDLHECLTAWNYWSGFVSLWGTSTKNSALVILVPFILFWFQKKSEIRRKISHISEYRFAFLG